ncbi:MAG: helix-turn-helix transcriptional regulator [Gallionellaceae bacterium]
MNLGKTIKELRISRHWAQDELAFRAKTSAANISRIESGKHGPSTRLLETIAYVFDMKMYQMVAIAEEEKLPIAAPTHDFAEQALLQNFRLMTPKERELFISISERFAKLGESV